MINYLPPLFHATVDLIYDVSLLVPVLLYCKRYTFKVTYIYWHTVHSFYIVHGYSHPTE